MDGVVPRAWRSLITVADSRGEHRVNRITYEICVLQALRERTRCKEIWVEGAERWRNPDQDLPADFNIRRNDYYETLRKPLDPSEFIDRLRSDLDSGLTKLNSFIEAGADGGLVKISERRNGLITVKPTHRRRPRKKTLAAASHTDGCEDVKVTPPTPSIATGR